MALTVAFALVKGGRPELIVQKLTELGIDTIVPFVAERSVVQWDEAKATRNVARLRRVAREAVMQSRRAFVPSVVDVVDFETVAARPGSAMAAAGGDPPTLDRPSVLIGPEGGWSERERHAPLPRVALGDGVLRSETAAVTAGALLAALRAGLVGGER